MVEKKMTLEKLAEMVARGFAGTDERSKQLATKADLLAFREEVEERFNKIENDISWIHGSMDVLRRELADIKEKLDQVVYRHELEQLRERVDKLERKLGFAK